jgi:hypothetical protein
MFNVPRLRGQRTFHREDLPGVVCYPDVSRGNSPGKGLREAVLGSEIGCSSLLYVLDEGGRDVACPAIGKLHFRPLTVLNKT